MIMLDSTACIDYLNGKNNLKEVLTQEISIYAISVVSIYEIEIGLERTKRKRSKDFYHKIIQKWLEFKNNLLIINLTEKEAEKASQIYDQLESKGIQIGDNDILIAASMLSNGIIKIVSHNIEHFSKIESIEVLNY